MLYDDITMNKIVTVQKLIDKAITFDDACELLQCSQRTVRRYISIYKKQWPPWFIHWLKWKRSNNRNKKREWLEKYARKKCYQWFWPTLLSEKLSEFLWYDIPVESLRRRMIERWLRTPKKPYKIKRNPRKRKKWYGIMIQFDWSYHDWLENWEERCLLLAVDDATWDPVHVKFTWWESIDDVLSFREEYFHTHGKPESIYLDRHSSYKVNHRKDQFDHTTVTRFQSGMNRLWVSVIFSKSPQWKWRVERKFWLFQDRGIKEMRLAWIQTYEEAQAYMDQHILPQFKSKFSVEAKVRWDFHVWLEAEEQETLQRIFAKRTKRKINNVWVVHYQWWKYLIKRWTMLNWTRNVIVLESHYWNIQIWNGEIQLCFEKVKM